MTIANTIQKTQYTGVGSVSTYSFPFPAFASTDIVVYAVLVGGAPVLLVNGTDYSVAGAGFSSTGGSITLINPTYAPLPTGALLTIQRRRPLTQQTDIRNTGSSFFPETLENEYDILTMIDQQMQEQLNRALVFPTTDAPLTNTLPIASTRANQFLAFDASGNVTVFPFASGGFATGGVFFGGTTGFAAQNAAAFSWDNTGLSLNLVGAAAANQILSTKVTGDTNPRFQLLADGTHSWGPGNAALDMVLNRSGVGILSMTGHLASFGAAVGSVVQSATVTGNGTLKYHTVTADGTHNWFTNDGDATAAMVLGGSTNAGVMTWPSALGGVTTMWSGPNGPFASAGGIISLRGPTGAVTAQPASWYLYSWDSHGFASYSIDNTTYSAVISTSSQAGAKGDVWLQPASSVVQIIGARLQWFTDNQSDIGASGANRPRSLYWATQALAPDGVVGTPSWSFASSTVTGAYRDPTSGRIGFTTTGAAGSGVALSSGGIVLDSASGFYFSATTLFATVESGILRDAANTVAIKNGTNAQTIRVYGTTTGPAYLSLSHDGTNGILMMFNNAPLYLGQNNTTRWYIQPNLYAVTDNSYDFGANGANRARSIYWGTQLLGPNGSAASPSYSFANGTGAGFYLAAVSNKIGVSFAGGASIVFDASNGNLAVGSNYGIAWATGTDPVANSADLILTRNAQSGAGALKLASSGTLTASPADFDQCVIAPALAGAFTITRNNYFACLNPTGASTTTDAALVRFDAAVGTHKALASNGSVATVLGSLGPVGSQTTVQGWLKINVNGTLRYIPFF